MIVSAVITTYKREPKILERALISVLNQTHKEIEIIVVDDSPLSYEFLDDVRQMMKDYEQKGVQYIKHEESRGACAARNTGLEAANGNFIGYLDDDDEWYPTKIEKQLEAFDSDEIALVFCGNDIVYEATGEKIKKEPLRIRGNVYERLMLDNFIGSTSFPLLRTEALRAIGGFDIEMQSAQDYDVWQRIAEKNDVNFVDESLVLYHFHESEQITKNPLMKIAGLERVNYKNIEFLKKHRKIYWTRYMSLVPWYAKAGNKNRAFSLWFKTIFKAPFKFIDNAKYLYSIFKN